MLILGVCIGVILCLLCKVAANYVDLEIRKSLNLSENTPANVTATPISSESSKS